MYRRWWFVPLMALLLGVATMALPALGADKTKVKVKEGSYFTLTCPSGQNAMSGQATYYDKNNQVITTQQGFVRGSEVLFGPAPKKSVYAIAELSCVPVETTTSSTASSSSTTTSSTTTTTLEPTTTTSSTTTTTQPPAPRADLRAVKFAPTEAGVDEDITYRINVTNLGPDPASRVIVTDTLPPGVEFAQVYAIGPSNLVCPVTNSSQVICEFTSPLAPGQMEDVYIVVHTTTNAFGGWTNNVDVRSDAEDPNIFNNHSQTSTDVACTVFC